MSQEIKITFVPEQKEVFVLPGTTVQEAASRLEIILEAPCGGKGTCGKCKVRVLDAAVPPTDTERKMLSAAEIQSGTRLACQARLTAPCTVEILAESRLRTLRILTGSMENIREINPGTEKRLFRSREAQLKEADSDATRVQDGWPGTRRAELDFLRKLPTALRENNFQGTLTTVDGRLIDFEPQDTTGRLFGMALDIGTTTVVGSLLDLRTGATLATGARLNPQVKLGDDVISRIDLVRRDRKNLAVLHRLIIDEINGIINELLAASGIAPRQVYEMSVAGNSVMLHLFLGITPEYLGAIPFPLAVREPVTIQPRELGLHLHPLGAVWGLPEYCRFHRR